MQSVINRAFEMFVRVQDFTEERAEAFPEESLAGETITELKRVIQTLTEAATSQNSGLSSVQRATAQREAARAGLREDMQLMARTARVMGLDIPGLENKFRLPRSGSDSALLQRARAFADDATEFKEQFIRYGMPNGFLDGLRAKIENLERAMGEQNTGRDEHVSATAAAEAGAERGMNAVRKLDAFIRNKYRKDPATLAAWESARHIEGHTPTRRRSNGSAGAQSPGDSTNV
ncbi:MAG TPA: hypothetical protein VF508_12635 [Pyrinomonadaceae bacterium]|jgi:hypothetical protein